MLYSMTGFGRSEKTSGIMQITVELKSLNGKGLDLNLKLSPLLRSFEHEIRSILTKALVRGTVDCNIQLKQDGVVRPMHINKELAATLYNEALALNQQLGTTDNSLLSTILRLPEVVAPSSETLDEDGWQLVKNALDEAVEAFVKHRKQEGEILEDDLKLRIETIQDLYGEVEKLAPQRKVKMREKLEQSLAEFLSNEKVDQNRLEQELIYYIEKFDITEEQVRLAEHCRYFLEALKTEETSKGKKLGFILQEVGREINTMGSKANDVNIQKFVINMKDELEKAKEQVLNTL